MKTGQERADRRRERHERALEATRAGRLARAEKANGPRNVHERWAALIGGAIMAVGVVSLLLPVDAAGEDCGSGFARWIETVGEEHSPACDEKLADRQSLGLVALAAGPILIVGGHMAFGGNSSREDHED